MATDPFTLPFEEAQEWFRRKLNIPTERWNELPGPAHARAFTSAGATQAELLADLRAMTDKAIAGQMDIREFRRQFLPLVERYGWQLRGGGPGWRADLIFHQNVQSAYQAGRWRQFSEAGVSHLKYVHLAGQLRPRPHHVALHGTVLPRSDPFWAVNWPPNGFRCKCRAVPASREEIADAGDEPQRPEGWENAPDKGFAYNVGRQHWEPDFGKHPADVKQAVLAGMAEAARKAGLYPKLVSHLTQNDAIDMETVMWMRDAKQAIDFEAWVDKVLKDMRPKGELYPLGNLPWSVIFKLESRLHERLRLALVTLDDKQLVHLARTKKVALGAALTADEIKEIPDRLKKGDWYWDTEEKNSLLVWTRLGSGKWLKVAIELNYRLKKMVINHIVTGGVVEPFNIGKDPRYEKLQPGKGRT